uniref:Ig-like domain-containing protein n=1 Tax=Astyanax mexicanus TaxID=7994 RepID=A0A8B9I1K3_ASTMX
MYKLKNKQTITEILVQEKWLSPWCIGQNTTGHIFNWVYCYKAVYNHFLYYIYTGLSKDLNLKGVYEFTALGLTDFYQQDDQFHTSRKSKEQWLKDFLDTIIQQMNHSNQDLHVLQWRHGCEIDESSGEVKFLRGISEYSYDGSDFLYFDYENMRWIAAVPQAEPTKRKWDNETIVNQDAKRYLEKECVDWLIKFMEYGKETLRKHSPPAVYGFAKKSVSDSKKVSLTCLATGFYPKDVDLSVRKFGTSIPDHLITTSGVRPNEDGTYQLRKSAEISDDPTDYDCNVHHSTIEEPAIKKWGKYNCDCKSFGIILGFLHKLVIKYKHSLIKLKPHKTLWGKYVNP